MVTTLLALVYIFEASLLTFSVNRTEMWNRTGRTPSPTPPGIAPGAEPPGILLKGQSHVKYLKG